MELTTRIDRLEEALERLAAAQAQVAEAQARTEVRLEALAAGQGHLLEAQARSEARFEQLPAAQTRTEVRLEQLVAAQAQLVEARARASDQLAELAEAQARTADQLAQLAAAQTRTEQQLGELLAWQRGEDGRRRGEQYEHRVARRAPRLFHGGEGGPTDRESVQRRLTALLAPSLREELPPNEDPLLADLVWWKGEQSAVVEVSNVVDEDDVDRAHRRAEALRRVGVPALAIVIGEAWADGETRAWAEALRVQWKVGDHLSEGFIAYRRLPWPTDEQ